MEASALAKNLHPLEVRILRQYQPGQELTIEAVELQLGLKSGNGNQALSWLQAKGLVSELRRENSVSYELTEMGRLWRDKGSPDERILELLADGRARALPEIATELAIPAKDVGSAYGALAKEGLLCMDEEKKVTLAEATKDPSGQATTTNLRANTSLRIKTVRKLLAAADAETGLLEASSLNAEEGRAIEAIAKKRGATDSPFRIVEREVKVFTLEKASADIAKWLEKEGISGDELGNLSPDMLATGSWKGKSFRPYNVQVPPTRLFPGRSNPYVAFLESVKDKLASLGFEEFDGSLVETEFWNSDALFMPQFHSARDIHDVYHLAEPQLAKEIEEPWLSNIAAAHRDGGNTGSRGWNYEFDHEFTRRLILRSQGTVLSARQLHKAKVPGKYFGIARCFRYDKVDATHLSDFYQTEGIVLGEDVNLRTLLGFLEMFAVEVAGASEVKYVPGYFPFTEPSIEVHIKHPVLGWFELGGSGIFRPEVTASMGVDVPVAAWGIGIDRMALMALGLNDLRELFSSDIENVRLRRNKDIEHA